MAKKSHLAMALLFLLILMTISGWASVPTMMNYQGKLTDLDGNPLTGTYDMTFYLFTAASGGSAIWSENHTSVAVTDGIYNVILGSINPLATGLFNDNDLVYLEVEIEGETFAPRQQLTSAPYALKARVSDAVVNGAITTIMIEDGAVDAQKVADSAITSGKVAANAITSAKIADGTVAAVDIADGAGSGLDADRLDGLEASAFMSSSADNWVNETGDTMTGPLTVTKPYFGTGFQHSIKGSLMGPNAVGAGVYGYSESSDAYGVYGGATGEQGSGVYGEAANNGAVRNYGGYFKAAGGFGRGVYGKATGGQGVGVWGESEGMYGAGVAGYASGENALGVIGQVSGTNSIAVAGTSESPDGYGGYFNGRVHVRHSDSGLTPTNNTGLFVENNGNGNDYFVFQTATARGKSFSITNYGRVGIGTTSPGYMLDAAGRARMLTGDSNSAGIWFTNADDSQNRAFFGMHGDDLLGFYGQGGTPGWGLVFNVNNKTVGIGTDDPGSFKLAVNGSAAKPGGGVWSTYSDARLKDIGERYKLGLEEITKIDPVKYRYKEDNALGLPSDGEHVGLIAQEVQEVIPEAVQQNKQGYLMVNEGPINYAMLNAIKELSAEVKRLKKRIEELEKR